jgi:hypothetical protein
MKQPDSHDADMDTRVNDQALMQMFARYENVLEVHIRYRQPANTVICPLFTGDRLAPSRYAFSQKQRWLFAGILLYIIPVIILMAAFFLEEIGRSFHLADSLRWLFSMFAATAAAVFVAWPVILPGIYVLVLLADLYLGWGKEGLAMMRGPSHISLSSLSFKLIWKGGLMVSTGAMFGWDEITSVDLTFPGEAADFPVPSMIIMAKNGNIIHTLPIRLDGFQSDGDRRLFLHGIDNHVSAEVKSARFKEYLCDGNKTALLLEKVREHSAEGLIELNRDWLEPELTMDKAAQVGLLCDRLAQQANPSGQSMNIQAKRGEPVARAEKPQSSEQEAH